jgi:hypothetical protein
MFNTKEDKMSVASHVNDGLLMGESPLDFPMVVIPVGTPNTFPSASDFWSLDQLVAVHKEASLLICSLVELRRRLPPTRFMFIDIPFKFSYPRLFGLPKYNQSHASFTTSLNNFYPHKV